MYEFVIVVEKGQIEGNRMRQVPHGNNFIKFGLKSFENIDVLSYLFSIVVFVFLSEIYVSVGVDIV